MNDSRVLNQQQIEEIQRKATLIGVGLGIAACVAAFYIDRAIRPAPALTGTPVILKKTLTETVVRIPMRDGDCVLDINRAAGTWSLNCGR